MFELSVKVVVEVVEELGVKAELVDLGEESNANRRY